MSPGRELSPHPGSASLHCNAPAYAPYLQPEVSLQPCTSLAPHRLLLTVCSRDLRPGPLSKVVGKLEANLWSGFSMKMRSFHHIVSSMFEHPTHRGGQLRGDSTFHLDHFTSSVSKHLYVHTFTLLFTTLFCNTQFSLFWMDTCRDKVKAFLYSGAVG